MPRVITDSEAVITEWGHITGRLWKHPFIDTFINAFAKQIFAKFEIDKSDFEAFSRPFRIAKISIKKIFKKSVYEHYEKQLTEKLSLINDSSKLFLYSNLKSDIKLEEYLKREKKLKNRQLLTKFRFKWS